MEEIKFEKAMDRLEKIVEDLEAGNLPLEDALKKYEEGVKLSRVCQQKLEESEQKIEILTRSLNGSLKAVPFDPEAAGGEEREASESKRPSAARKSPARKQAESSDEDLLI